MATERHEVSAPSSPCEPEQLATNGLTMTKKNRLRISLRTFLLVVFVIAVAVGLVGKFYNDSKREKAVVESLQNSGFYFSGSEPNYGTFHPVPKPLSWLGEGHFRQRRHLDVYFDQGRETSKVGDTTTSRNLDRSLEPLKHFRRLESLTVATTSHVTLTATSNALSPIRDLKGLSDLKFRMPVTGDLEFLSNQGLPKLERLAFHNRSSEFSDNALKNIASNQTLQMLEIACETISENHLAEIAKLKNLTHLTIHTQQLPPIGHLAALEQLQNLSLNLAWWNGKAYESSAIPDLAPLRRLKHLKHLSLGGAVEPRTLVVLESCFALEQIEFLKIPLPDACVAPLKRVPNLVGVLASGSGVLSRTAYDQLVAHGINTEHYGLRGVERDHDLLHFDDMDYEVDTTKSEFSISIDKSGQLHGSVDVSTTDKYAPSFGPLAHLYSPGFKLPASWQESRETVFDKIDDVEYGNLYCGIHLLPTDNRLQILKVFDSAVHVRYRFTTDNAQKEYYLDATLPFNRIVVSERGPLYKQLISLEEAKQFVAKHFDLDRFEVPQEKPDSPIVFQRIRKP